MKLSTFQLYDQTASTPLRQAGGNLTEVTRTEHLEKKNELSAKLMRGSIGWEKYQRRRLLRMEYNGGRRVEWWRITRISDSRQQKITLTLRPRYADLEDTMAYVETGSQKIPSVTITGLSPSAALDRILNALPAPDLYTPGDVASAFSGERVYLWGEGVSYWRLLQDLASEEKGGVEGCIRFEWDGSQYLVHLDEIGAEATMQTVTFSSLTEGIQGKDLSLSIDDSNYFSTVAPVGGQRNERITIAGARWVVASSSLSGGETTLTTQGAPIWEGGALVGRYIEGDTGATYEVLSTTLADTVTVDGDATGESSFRFIRADGSDLVTLTDQTAERELGRAVKSKQFSQVAPYSNLLKRAGVTDNAEDKTGWNAQGTLTTFDTLFDVLSTQHGSASIRVEADKAGSDPQNGIYANAVTWDSSTDGKYVSAVVQLRVLSGSIGVELEDSAGNRFPARGGENEIVGAADTIRGYQLGGFEPADGDLKLRIFAREDGTEFHMDAASITASTGARSYSSLMGPRALWDRAARHLRKEGGIQAPRLDVTTFTVTDVEGFRATVETGDLVRVVTEAGVRREPVRTRVRTVQEDLSVGREAGEQQITLGKRLRTFIDRREEEADRSEPVPQTITVEA